MKQYKLTYLNIEHNVILIKTKYTNNNTLALHLNEFTEDGEESFGTISTNLELSCNDNEIYVKEPKDKYDWEEEFLTKNNIAIKIPNTRIKYNYNIYNKFSIN
ncbi:MAG: hypothetical protein R3Y64_11385 [Peptostreptococcaceae bacterium]